MRRQLGFPILLIITAATAATAGCSRAMKPAGFVEGAVQEFVIPWQGAFPSDVAVDTAGVLWFTDRLQHRIGSFDARTRRFRSYDTPTKKSAPYGLIADGAGGLWFTESRAGRIGRIDARTGKIREYVLPGVTRGPHHLAISGGRIWFSLRESRGYGWLNPATGEAQVTSTPFMQPYAVAAGNDSTVWQSGFDAAILLVINTRTLAADTVHLPVLPPPSNLTPAQLRYAGPRTIVMRRMSTDPAGRVWITDFRNNRVVSFDPADATLREHPLPRGAAPYGITADANGIIWYHETSPSQIVALDPATGSRRAWQPATRSASIRDIAIDVKRGRVWLPLSDAGRIGLITLPAPK